MVSSKMSNTGINKKESIWVMQSLYIMSLQCDWRFSSIFGTVVEVKQMSTNDKLERKKYMGVCRWESEIVIMMMNRFPNTVTRYIWSGTVQRGQAANLGPLKFPKKKLWNLSAMIRLYVICFTKNLRKKKTRKM